MADQLCAARHFVLQPAHERWTWWQIHPAFAVEHRSDRLLRFTADVFHIIAQWMRSTQVKQITQELLHLCNGVRHLGWDVGLGFEKARARMTGWLTVVIAVVLTLGFWAAALASRGG